MKILLAILTLALLMGCETLTTYEKAERTAVDLDVWAVCVANYKHKGIPMSSIRYTATRIKPNPEQLRRQMLDDIRTNNCRAIYRAAMEIF